MKRFNYPLIIAAAIIGLNGCTTKPTSGGTVTLATTTSTRDSGLLAELLPVFEERTGIRVRVVAVGSGQALALGRRGDADILLTHAPDMERKFMNDGYGIARRQVMFNDFVLVGPAGDPAQVRTAKDAADAFRLIAGAGALFVSRGDDSGTHRREQAIWRAADIMPVGPWYLKAGAGMAQTLRVAAEKRAYCLTDRATWLAQSRQLELRMLYQNDSALRNLYSVILVNPNRFPHVRAKEARELWQFLRSEEARRLINGFGVRRYGQPLFHTIDEEERASSTPSR